MMILGITGGIASGKSLVTEYFRQFNYPIIDADIVSREVVEPGEKGLEAVRNEFGNEIITDSGDLNREKLGQIIFADEDKRDVLNNILHPIIWETIETRLLEYKKQNADLIVMDIPLLFESNMLDIYDHTLVIYVPENVQLERLMARNGLSKEEARQRIEAQMPLEEKKRLADTVIDNSGIKENTFAQVERWMDQQGIVK